MYEAATHDILVQVSPAYMAAQSTPADESYFWTYTIVIVNNGARPVQLKSRLWRITDMNGHTEEVRGEGVVGEQPVIEPGGSYTYTSGCPLRTPSGIMVGSYRMVTADGVTLDVAIPAFSLDSPFAPRRMN